MPQSPVTVSATASSGLPVSFLTTTPGVCRPGGANGATIKLVKVGTCTVAGYQLGNWEYFPAAPVSQSFRALALPTLTTTPSSTSVTLGTSSVTLKDTAVLSGGYSPTGTITFTLYYNGATTPVDTEEATVSGNGSYSTPAGYTLPTTGTVAGTYQWDASYSGDTDNASVSDNGAAGEQVTVTAEWQTGDLTTYNQVEWSGGTPGLFSSSNWSSVYPEYGVLTVGSSAGFTMEFDSGAALYNYLPAVGPVGPLDANLLDPPGSTASGAFGGDVVSLALNVDYSGAGLLQGSSDLNFGDLFVCGLTTDTDLNGLTVSEVLGIENTALGGGTTTDSIADLDAIASDLSGAFDDGTPSTFALDHLAEDSSCTAVNWADGAMVTYSETEWQQQYLGLLLDFSSVYSSDFGELTVGTPYYLAFDSGDAVLAYLPATGAIGSLDENLLDPTSSPSGSFGGDVVALALNVDFSAAGYIQGSSGLQFGDLTVCGLSTDTDLNGLSVSGVLSVESSALGDGGATDPIADLDSLAIDLNLSFDDGTPSSWAQAHLVDGSCA